MMDRTPRLASVMLALVLILAATTLLACEGQTITIEQSTPDPEGTRGLSAPVSTRPPIPTPEPGERVAFLPMSDGAALMALFDATGGGDWGNRDGWLYEIDLGQWYGATADADADGWGTALELRSIGLSGELPEEIGYLTELAELNLSNNSLTGTLPAEIGGLTNLEELYLNSNQFSGALPATLGALTALHLYDKQFEAEFSAALGPLSELDSVSIWNYRFYWADSYEPGLLSDPSVAAWIGVSTNNSEGSVTGLNPGENELHSVLPQQLGNLDGLTTLSLHFNQLEGEMPARIGNLTGPTG